MNAVELFHQDGKSAGVWYCGKCRIVHLSKEFAERCCKNYICEDCGKDTGGRSWLVCDRCRDIREAKRERDLFEKAEKLTAWSGWVYCDGLGNNNGFFESIDELIEDCEIDGSPLPEYVWACNATPFAQLDVDDLLNNIAEDSRAYEDFDPHGLDGIVQLREAIAKFNEANAKVFSYEPDHKRAVLIRKQ